MATSVKKKPGPKPHPRGKAEIAAPKNPAIKSKAQIATKLATQEKRFAKLRALAVNNSTVKNQAIKSPNRHLTEMQQMFVRHWAAGESILTAASRAGYSDGGTYAYRLSKDPLVIEIYQREKRLFEEACQMTRKRVMDGFLEAAEMARLQADPTALTGAWREIGKMCGYYQEQRKVIDVNISGSVTTKVERLSDDQLLRLIKGEAGAEIIDMDFAEVPALEGPHDDE